MAEKLLNRLRSLKSCLIGSAVSAVSAALKFNINPEIYSAAVPALLTAVSQPLNRRLNRWGRFRFSAGSEGDGTAGGLVGSPMRPTASSSAPASQRAACDPFAPPPPPPRASLLGNQRPVGALIPLVTHTNCSEWVEPRYRVCADVSGAWASELGADGAANGWNFFYLAGRWYRQRFTASHPAGR